MSSTRFQLIIIWPYPSLPFSMPDPKQRFQNPILHVYSNLPSAYTYNTALLDIGFVMPSTPMTIKQFP